MSLDRAIHLLKVSLARSDAAQFCHSDTIGMVSGKLDKARGELCEALELLRAIRAKMLGRAEELRRSLEPQEPDPDQCHCWHASNRGEIGETLQHPNGFHCIFCEDSGVLQRRITFTRLKDGTWAVRGPLDLMVEGTLVQVHRRDRVVKEILLGKRAWCGHDRENWTAVHYINDERDEHEWALGLDVSAYPIFHPY